MVDIPDFDIQIAFTSNTIIKEMSIRRNCDWASKQICDPRIHEDLEDDRWFCKTSDTKTYISIVRKLT